MKSYYPCVLLLFASLVTTGVGAADAPVAKPLNRLPEFYGVFLMTGKELIPLAATPKEVSGDVNFLIFDKNISAISQQDVTVYKLRASSMRDWRSDGLQGWDLFNAQTEKRVSDLVQQGRGVPSNARAIRTLTKPVNKQPEMVQVVPEVRLEPGIYQLASFGRFTVALDDYVKGIVSDAEKAVQKKEFEKAFDQAIEAEALLPANDKARERMAELKSKSLVGIAERLLAEGKLDKAQLYAAEAQSKRQLVEISTLLYAIRWRRVAANPENNWEAAAKQALELFTQPVDAETKKTANEKYPVSSEYNEPLDFFKKLALNRDAVRWETHSKIVDTLAASRDTRLVPTILDAFRDKFAKAYPVSCRTDPIGAYAWLLGALDAKEGIPALKIALAHLTIADDNSFTTHVQYSDSLAQLEQEPIWKKWSTWENGGSPFRGFASLLNDAFGFINRDNFAKRVDLNTDGGKRVYALASYFSKGDGKSAGYRVNASRPQLTVENCSKVSLNVDVVTRSNQKVGSVEFELTRKPVTFAWEFSDIRKAIVNDAELALDASPSEKAAPPKKKRVPKK